MVEKQESPTAVEILAKDRTGDDERAPFVALGDQREQHLGLVGVLLDVAQIVEDQEITDGAGWGGGFPGAERTGLGRKSDAAEGGW